MRIRHLLWTGLVLLVAGAGLRFARLGEWSLGPDEYGTFWEVDLFHGHLHHDNNDPNTNVPAMIPVAMIIQSVGHDLFGKDEFGARAIHALLGSLHIVIVFFFLAKLVDYPTGIMTALMLMLTPAHLFHSQYHRFYMPGLIIVSLCQLSGAFALERRSWAWSMLASVFVIIAILTHTLLVVVLGSLTVGLLVGLWLQRLPIPRRILGTLLAATLAVVLLFLLYLIPLLTAKAEMSDGWERYGLFRSVAASVIQVGWPTLLLAGLGSVMFWNRQRIQASYWIVQSLMWIGCSVALPIVIPYHPEYVFPMILGIIVLAGYATGQILVGFWQQQRLLGFAWVLVISLFNLPELVSYYQDGNRHDYRSAASYIQSHFQEGDRIAAYSPKLIQYYSANLPMPERLHQIEVVNELKQLTQQKNRLWIIISSGRSGVSMELRQWLTENCSLKWRAIQRRFDYYNFLLEIYLFQ